MVCCEVYPEHHQSITLGIGRNAEEGLLRMSLEVFAGCRPIPIGAQPMPTIEFWDQAALN